MTNIFFIVKVKFSELIKTEKKSESQTKLFLKKENRDLDEFNFLERYFFLDNYRRLKPVQ